MTTIRSLACLALLLASACHVNASRSAPLPEPASPPPTPPAPVADTNGMRGFADQWWHALAVADTSYLRAYTSPELSLTLSTGRRYDRDAMLAEAATHRDGHLLSFATTDEAIAHAVPGAVVVTSRVTERGPGGSITYRFLTVIEDVGSTRRVAVAQSTRELVLTERAPAAVVGNLADYAGRYVGRLTRQIEVVVRDSGLVLVEPYGGEVRMTPIGPALFESTTITPGLGVVRFSFARDARGRVTSFNRIAGGVVNVWPRVPPTVSPPRRPVRPGSRRRGGG